MRVDIQQAYKMEVPIVKEEKRQVKFINSERKVPGHIMYEHNPATGEIKPATYKEAEIEFTGNLHTPSRTRLKLVVNDGCDYVQALNKRNAIKKLRL